MASSFWTGGPHPTSGLSGYPARDYGAPGGTPVYAWSSLRVKRISGQAGYRGGGFGGYNLYLEDRAGREYFMTHTENLRVKSGTILQPGQQIAQVGSYGTPHVHLGYTGGDPSSILGIKPEHLFTPGGSIAGSKAIEKRVAATTRQLTPQQKVAVGRGIIRGDIKAGDLPPDSKVQTGGPFADEARAVVGAIQSPLDALRWMMGNWDRVAEVIGGFVLLLVGLILLARSMGVGGRSGRVGDLANRFQYGPTVVQARPEPQMIRVHEVTDAGERATARSQRARGAGPSNEIPY